MGKRLEHAKTARVSTLLLTILVSAVVSVASALSLHLCSCNRGERSENNVSTLIFLSKTISIMAATANRLESMGVNLAVEFNVVPHVSISIYRRPISYLGIRKCSTPP